MYAKLFFCSCLWIQSVLTLACCNLHSKFKEFHELTPDNFTVVVKRDAMSGQEHLKIVTFFALRKYFVLHLVSGSPVLRADFVAHMVDGEGRMTPVHVDQQIFYTGHLNDNPQHSVDAVHTDNVWIAQIHGPDDVYSIEPLTHHVPDSPATSMLIFRQRDMNSSVFSSYSNDKATLQPFCEEVQLKQHPLSDSQAVKQRNQYKNNNSTKIQLYHKKIRNNDMNIRHRITNSIYSNNFSSETHSSKHHRRRSNVKRDSRLFDTCEMLVIADFEAYQGIGRSNIFRMISILVFLYQSIDRIYRETIFDTFTNLGIVIARLIVHTEYTHVDTIHYNMPNNNMSAVRTLMSMTTVPHFSHYCLVHLSTQRNLGGTLGIAVSASKDTYLWQGGLCARYRQTAGNVGLSTPINSMNITLPVITYLLVIAHEIGHNIGSNHDPPEDPECSPSSENGGKYIMWASAGYEDFSNSKKFSPCSRRQIGLVLDAKAHLCLKPRNVAEEVCGNSIVDPGEDCDVGYAITDSCCTSRCRFPDNAVCSPVNHPCCTNSCQIAPPTQKCFVDIHDCHEDALCSGTESYICPEPRALPNNSTCQSLGKCWQGKCVSFCELLGATFTPARRLLDCTCDQDRLTMCYHCCWDPQSKQGCTKMGGSKINGSPCMMGICDRGLCTDIEMDDDFHFDESSKYLSLPDSSPQLGRLADTVLAVTAVSVLCHGL